MPLSPVIRHGASLVAAVAVTWWFLFRVPAPAILRPQPTVPAPLLQIARAAASAQPAPQEEEAVVEPEPASAAELLEDGAAPPEEAGSRKGKEDGELQLVPEEAAEQAMADRPPKELASDANPRGATAEALEPVDTLTELAEDRELLEAARRELDGEVKLGFSTQFICAAADQLAIARAFSEQVVLIPRSALDDDDSGASSYVLDLGPGGEVRQIPGRPDLSRFRQYRDLFGFEFAALPEPVRRLRTSVVRRDQIFLFAALIPAGEWAIAVGRRRQVLERISRREEDVERFTLRYVPAQGGRFDFSVESIEFADGSKWRARGLPRR